VPELVVIPIRLFKREPTQPVERRGRLTVCRITRERPMRWRRNARNCCTRLEQCRPRRQRRRLHGSRRSRHQRPDNQQHRHKKPTSHHRHARYNRRRAQRKSTAATPLRKRPSSKLTPDQRSRTFNALSPNAGSERVVGVAVRPSTDRAPGCWCATAATRTS
jgi:hypothetical protein